MNRYKISKASFPIVRRFLNGEKIKQKDVPSYARKFKKDLKFVNKKLFLNDKRVIPAEDVDDYLRMEFYDKKSNVPLSRDGGFHSLKKTTVGITRARLMNWIKSQPASVSTAVDIAKPRRSGQVKRRKYHIETDLVFIRKPDFVQISDEFENTITQKESYIVSTVESVTGLTKLDYIKKKSDAMPVILKHIKSISKTLGVPLKDFTGASDKGEVKMSEITKYIPKWKFVFMGPRIEQLNSVIQRHIFRIARQGRGHDIKDLIKQAESIQNNNFNSVLKRTANESAEIIRGGKSREVLAEFNKTRQPEITSLKTKFKVGDYVRLRLITKKGIAFKSYKGKTFSKKVYKITHVTKTSVPQKYRVSGRWYTKNTLLKTQLPDEKSIKLVQQREEAVRQKNRDHLDKRKKELRLIEEEHKKQQVRDEEKQFEVKAPKKKKALKKKAQKKKVPKKKEKVENEPQAPPPRRSRRSAALKARKRQLDQIEKNRDIDEYLRADEG